MIFKTKSSSGSVHNHLKYMTIAFFINYSYPVSKTYHRSNYNDVLTVNEVLGCCTVLATVNKEWPSFIHKLEISQFIELFS